MTGTRGAFLALLWTVAAACDPAYAIHYAVVSTPSPQQPSAVDPALELIARIAEQHGLRKALPRANEFLQWTHCFQGRGSWICAKTAEAHLEIQLGQRGTSKRLRPAAERLRLEITDSLAARFGRAAIRECDLHAEPVPDAPWWNRTYQSACIPKAQPESTTPLPH